MSKDFDRHEIEVAIDEIEGYWPEPPKKLSVTSIDISENCPRRWALRNGDFPNLWDKSGYPPQVTLKALLGDIIHRSIEQVVEALSKAGCDSPSSPGAIGVLKELGGFSSIIERETLMRIQELNQNPRMRNRSDEFLEGCKKSHSHLVSKVRSLLAQLVILPKSPFRTKTNGTATTELRTPTVKGTYLEQAVESDYLKLRGRIDFLTLDGPKVAIVDFKSGEMDQSHIEQVRNYGILWVNRNGRPTDEDLEFELALVYPDRVMAVEIPDNSEIQVLTERLKDRIETIISDLSQVEPPARPAIENCRFCEVRHLCDPYWEFARVNKVGENFVDYEIKPMLRNGPRSWVCETRSEMNVLLWLDPNEEVEIGVFYRISNLTQSEDEMNDSKVLVLSKTKNSEIYRLKN